VTDFPPYPVFLRIDGRPCLVVGGGIVAHRKALDLLECGALVTVVAETPSPAMAALAESSAVRLIVRRVGPEDIRGAFLVFAATDDERVNAEIAGLAREAGILVNAADDPDRCDFILGAVVKRGPLRIAVSTSGCGPLIASGIRRELEEQYDEPFGSWVAAAGEIRARILAEPCPRVRKDEALQWVAGRSAHETFLESGSEGVWSKVRNILSSS
jgi:precorrin-2 dehydrogenase / sirohydrochlorin ferrochelatase